MKQERYNQLYAVDIINGCGASGGFNFSDFYKNNIKIIEAFKPELNASLLNTIELRICGPHDVDCHNGNTKLHFYWANFKGACRLLRILRWAGFVKSLICSLIFFFGTNKFGKKTFNFGEKKYIKI